MPRRKERLIKTGLHKIEEIDPIFFKIAIICTRMGQGEGYIFMLREAGWKRKLFATLRCGLVNPGREELIKMFYPFHHVLSR